MPYHWWIRKLAGVTPQSPSVSQTSLAENKMLVQTSYQYNYMSPTYF